MSSSPSLPDEGNGQTRFAQGTDQQPRFRRKAAEINDLDPGALQAGDEGGEILVAAAEALEGGLRLSIRFETASDVVDETPTERAPVMDEADTPPSETLEEIARRDRPLLRIATTEAEDVPGPTRGQGGPGDADRHSDDPRFLVDRQRRCGHGGIERPDDEGHAIGGEFPRDGQPLLAVAGIVGNDESELPARGSRRAVEIRHRLFGPCPEALPEGGVRPGQGKREPDPDRRLRGVLRPGAGG